MAQSDNILPKSLADKLKCSECKQYLSVPPITYTAQGYKCGRCLPSTSLSTYNESKLQVEVYETLAQIIRFPCRYDSEGCTEFCNFDEIINHENQCQFKTIECPIETCKKEITVRRVLQHFQKEHKNLTTSSAVFSIPKGKNVKTQKLLTLNARLLLLEMLVSDENKCWLTLLCFDEMPTSCEIYQLEIRSSENTSTLVLNQHVLKYSVDYTENEKNVLDIHVLKTVLNSEKIEIAIKFPNTETERETETLGSCDLLQELECLVCSEYMVPPIYICTTGHSVCCTCKMILQKCPTCRAEYEGTRNFALERVSEHFRYPCKNRSNGCTFLGTARAIYAHEPNCAAKLVKCPLSKEEKCEWTGFPHKILDHAKKFHPSWIKLGQKMYRNLRGSTLQKYHIVKYDDEIFKIFMKHDGDNSLSYWAVDHLQSSNQQSKYLFTLQFIDKTDAERVLMLKERCYYSGGNQCCIILPYSLLEPFMQNDEKVIFTINIEKIKISG